MKMGHAVLCVVLLIGVLTSAHVKGSEGECLGAGYNVVTQQCSQVPFFATTYDRNRGYNNPYTGQYELWPDHVTLLDMDQGQIDSSVLDIRTWDAYVTMLDKSLSVSIGFGYRGMKLGLAFKHSKGTYNYFSKESTFYFAQQTRTIELYKLMIMRSLAAPTDSITKVYQALDSKCSSGGCITQYCQFINTYGTHVVTGIYQGGYQNVTVQYDKSLTTNHSSSWVSNEIDVSVSFMKQNIGQLGVGIGRNISKSQINATFLEHAHFTSNTMGGDLALEKNFTLWLPTVYTHSVSIMPVEGDIVPVYEIFPPTSSEDVQRGVVMRSILISYIESGGLCPKEVKDYPTTHHNKFRRRGLE